MRKPGVSRGTRNNVVPCLSGTVASVRASMKNSLPIGALAMKAFSPLRIHSSPLRSALSFSPALMSSGGRRLSEPALGSVMPLPSRKVSSATKGLQEARLLLLGAGRRDQMAPFPVLAERLGDRAVGLGQLGHHQRLRHEIGAVAAPLLRHRQSAEAELGALLDDVPVEGSVRGRDGVAFERDRTDLLLGEFARRHLPGALFVAQIEVHGTFLA